MQLVNIVCAYLVEKHGYYPTVQQKEAAARAILEKFPTLTNPQGKTGYISQDFEELHSVEIGNRFLSNWEECAEKLIQLATTSENPAITALLEEYRELSTEQPISKDMVSLYGLQILLLWLPCFNTRKKAKCSQADLMSRFLDCQPIGTIIEEYLEEIKSTKLPLQPFLLGIGPNLGAIQQFFIIVDGIAISLGTYNVTSAADACFKFHYVFDFHYSTQLSNFYCFLQDVFYKLELKTPIPKRVMELKLALQNVK